MQRREDETMVDLTGPAPIRGTATPQRPQAQASARNARPADADLSGKTLPHLISLAAELSSAPPPVDQSRLAEIRTAISAGTYHLDPDRIARALLGDKE
jgi:flagellar biosynthesis anti-sigma factor FlgM